jgi:hypothetical protein
MSKNSSENLEKSDISRVNEFYRSNMPKAEKKIDD